MLEKAYDVLRIPSLVEAGYEVVDTATMSLAQRLITCLNNDMMADVHIVGEDGVKVNACKYVLASASSQLQTLLYQGDEEKSVISIPNCRAKTLRALVEYSCSDMLNTAIWSDTDPVEIVEDMVALAKLAERYALPNLKQQVSDVLSPCLEQLPSLACVAYNLVDTKSTAELHAAALEVLRKKPYQAFVKGPGGDIGGIACLSPEKLDCIFRDQEISADEIFLFQCLQEWKAANDDNYPNTGEICRMVAQNLDFSAMNASDIEEIVLPSGLVDSSHLVSGLMTLAKSAEKKGFSLRSSRRRHAKAQRASDSSTGSIPPRSQGRGRRFKKPDPASDVSYASTQSQDEGRDESEAPVTVVKAQVSAPIQKKVRKPSFGFGSRFLGGLRSHNVKAIPEEESFDTAPPKMQASKEESKTKPSGDTQGPTERTKEAVSCE